MEQQYHSELRQALHDQRYVVVEYRGVSDQRLRKRKCIPLDYGPFDAEGSGARVPELRAIYGKTLESYPDLPAVTAKKRMTPALRKHEEAHPDECEEVESPASLYGATHEHMFNVGDICLSLFAS